MIGLLLKRLISLREKMLAAENPVAFARRLGVHVGDNVRFYGVSRGTFGSEPWLISIGSHVYITAGVQFVTHDGGTLILRHEEPTLEWTAPIEVGDYVYIGVKSIILPNVRIGSRCVIGAGSVVTRDVPSNSVFAGVPARYICSVDEYLEKLRAKSLRVGHLPSEQKAAAIKEFYERRGWFAKNRPDSR